MASGALCRLKPPSAGALRAPGAGLLTKRSASSARSARPGGGTPGGLVPDQEQALYLTAVGLGLFMGAIGLFYTVFWQGGPQTASDPAELHATGGSGV